MKRFRALIIALLVVAFLATPKSALAYDGCSASACWSTGYYLEWSWFGPYACNWWVVSYYGGDTVYGDCHSNFTY